MLQAAKKTKENVLYAFIGDGPLANRIQAGTDGMKNAVFVGKVEAEGLPLYYGAADVVVVPSQYEEGYGRVILEALSCGTPVLCSNKGGIPEAVDGSVGILIDPTPQNIKEKVEFLSKNSDELEALVNNCRTYAERRFSAANVRFIEKKYSA